MALSSYNTVASFGASCKLLLINILLICNPGMGVRMFSFQADVWAPPRLDVYIKYELWKYHTSPFSTTDTFTICYRAYHTTLPDQVVHLSYAESEDYINGILIYFIGEMYSGYYNDIAQLQFNDLQIPLQLWTWQHYCHIQDRGKRIVYIDGKLKYEGPVTGQKQSITFNGTVILGQEQDEVGGGFTCSEIFRGNLTQYNIWDRRLTSQEIKDMASCKTQIFGNILSSDVHDGEIVNVTVEDVELQDLCETPKEFTVIPRKFLFSDGKDFCIRTGSAMYTPSSAESNSKLFKLAVHHTDTCDYFIWLGITDEIEEGIWRSLSSNTTSPTFFETQSQNSPDTNCASMLKYSGLWDIDYCDLVPRCFACTFIPSSFILLRGLCFTAKHKRSFQILSFQGGKAFFQGLYGYNIYYYSPKKQWILFDILTNQTVAHLAVDSPNTFPVGLHEWHIVTSVCDFPQDSKQILSLSVCRDDQFTCFNGDCISRELRCDTNDDCTDQTDEDNCQTVTIPRSYRSHKPPKNATKGKPLALHVDIQVLRFFDIEDAKNYFSIEFKTVISWQDSRLLYTNLQNISRVSGTEMKKLWRPALEFPNVKNGQIVMLRESITVTKIGNVLPPNINYAVMDNIFPSSAGQLNLATHYTGAFVCRFEMFYYPFDTQHCSVEIELSSIAKTHVVFDSVESEYQGVTDLASYVVRGMEVQVVHNPHAENSVLQIEFELSRNPLTVVLGVYIPTSMLLTIGYSTLHVSLALLQVRVVVSLTALLVLYTLYNQTSSSLPKTAYVKMIDIWFFFCIFVLFSLILFHVFVDKINVVAANSNRQAPVGVIRDTKAVITVKTPLTPERAIMIMRIYIVPTCVIVCLIIYCSVLAYGIH